MTGSALALASESRLKCQREIMTSVKMFPCKSVHIYGSQAYFISDASTIPDRKHMKVPLYKGLKWMELLLPIQLLPNRTKFGAGTSFGGSGGGGGPARLAGGSGVAGSSGA